MEDEEALHTVIVETAVSETTNTTSNTTSTATSNTASNTTSNTTSTATTGHHTVRVIVTNGDSDSDSDHQPSHKSKSKLSSLFSKHSSSQVTKLESGQVKGQGHSASTRNSQDSITEINEDHIYSLTKHRLKPKLPQSQLLTNLPATSSTRASTLLNASTKGRDFVLTLGDLELEDFDEPVKVHSGGKKIKDEHIV